MSSSVSVDILNQIISMRNTGQLTGAHTHAAANGGAIQTDTTIRFRNALQPIFDSDSQMLNPNLNADLWRGQRYYVQATKPKSANKGDILWDGSNFWVWSGTTWLAFTSSSHTLLDGNIDSDTVATTVQRGMIPVGNSTPKWAGLALGASGTYLRSNGTDLLASALLAGDVSGILAVGNIPNLPASIITSGILPIARGGTNLGAYTSGSVIFFDGTSLQQDNLNLFWDATNKRVGVGTASPRVTLDVSPASAIFDIGQGVSGNPRLRLADSVNAAATGDIQSFNGPFHMNYLGNNIIMFGGGFGGNLGIGTTNPSFPLDVSAGATNEAAEFTGTGGNLFIGLKNTGAGGREWFLISGANASPQAPNKFFIFDNTAGATRLVIDSAGNVGMGIASPATNLDVNGNITVHSDVLPSGNKIVSVGVANATQRFNFGVFSAVTTGTSRLINSGLTCSDCNVCMVRSTGETIMLGEDYDYSIAWCPKCFKTQMEEIDYPSDFDRSIPEPTSTEFLGMTVTAGSGNSYRIKADFKYVYGNKEYFNSAYIGRDEKNKWLDPNTSVKDRRAMLKEWARAEWKASILSDRMQEYLEKMNQRLSVVTDQLKGII